MIYRYDEWMEVKYAILDRHDEWTEVRHTMLDRYNKWMEVQHAILGRYDEWKEEQGRESTWRAPIQGRLPCSGAMMTRSTAENWRSAT